MKGVVSWFNDSKGYGFIEVEGHEPVFAHYSAIEGEGFKTLCPGQRVEFEVIQARNIRAPSPWNSYPMAKNIRKEWVQS